MRTIFQIGIVKESGCGTQMRKVVNDLSFLPPVGMDLADVAWCDVRKITGVTLSIGGKCLFVSVEPEQAENNSDFLRFVDEYKHHGWKEHAEDT